MIFRFKQFNIDQTGCAMKINTDGVLLGTLATCPHPRSILDIGTGTGVIAMMMAQRFPDALVDAVELDSTAAATAERNFRKSDFSSRLKVYPASFQQYLETHPGKKYDLIISNPPFYIHALHASSHKKNLAKHTGEAFFESLVKGIFKHLAAGGEGWLILHLQTAAVVKALAAKNQLYITHNISVHSFAGLAAHREIIVLSPTETKSTGGRFIIYDTPNVYSKQYRDALKDFFTIF